MFWFEGRTNNVALPAARSGLEGSNLSSDNLSVQGSCPAEAQGRPSVGTERDSYGEVKRSPSGVGVTTPCCLTLFLQAKYNFGMGGGGHNLRKIC